MSLARISCVAVLALTTACAGTLKNGIYREGDVRYRVGSIPAGWKAVGLSGNDLAYQSLDSPHSVAINATCVDHDDPPLDVLTRHLLMGFTERETLSQEVEALDGRDALRTRVTAKLGGVPGGAGAGGAQLMFDLLAQLLDGGFCGLHQLAVFRRVRLRFPVPCVRCGHV